MRVLGNRQQIPVPFSEHILALPSPVVRSAHKHDDAPIERHVQFAHRSWHRTQEDRHLVKLRIILEPFEKIATSLVWLWAKGVAIAESDVR